MIDGFNLVGPEPPPPPELPPLLLFPPPLLLPAAALIVKVREATLEAVKFPSPED